MLQVIQDNLIVPLGPSQVVACTVCEQEYCVKFDFPHLCVIYLIVIFRFFK